MGLPPAGEGGNLPLGSTKSVSHTLGFTMLAGYKF